MVFLVSCSVLLSPLIFLSLHKIPISLSGTMLHFHTVLLALRNYYEQPFPALQEIPLQYSNSPHSLSLSHPILFWQLQQPHILTLSPRYVNSNTVSTSHNLSSCSTASPIFPSHFLHVIFLGNSGVTLSLWHIYRGSIYHIGDTKLS